LAASFFVGAFGLLGATTSAGASAPTHSSSSAALVSGYKVVDLKSDLNGPEFTKTLCGFTPRSSVAATDNGALKATAVAGTDGCLTLVGETSQSRLNLLGGTRIPIGAGPNVVSVTGTGTDGALQTQTTQYNVASESTAGARSLALNGADVMAMLIAGLALVALGFLLVTFTRRRIQPSVF
jgi:hypothetical protein